jgi:hypothetical protein
MDIKQISEQLVEECVYPDYSDYLSMKLEKRLKDTFEQINEEKKLEEALRTAKDGRGRPPKYTTEEQRKKAIKEREKKWREEHKEELRIKRIAENHIPKLEAKLYMYRSMVDNWNLEHTTRQVVIPDDRGVRISESDIDCDLEEDS